MQRSGLSISSPQQIMNSPLNRSSAKFHYSFSKSPRFRKPLLYCDQSYYKTAEMKSRAASFGYGKKSDFTKCLTDSPDSTLYRIDSLFEKNRKKFKGSSFGLGRELMKECSYIQHALVKHPGPGQYGKAQLQPRERSYSMRPKTEDPWMPSKKYILKPKDFLKSKDEQYDIPGPGQYDQIKSLQGDGKYFYSKFKSSGATVINPSSKRFHTESSIVPGPGDYEQMNSLTDDGSYLISNYRGQGKRVFGVQKRKSFIDEAVKYSSQNPIPGPGNYKQHSEFGLYENPALIAKNSRPYTAEFNHRLPTRESVKRMNMTTSQL